MSSANTNDRINFIIELLNELNNIQNELINMDNRVKEETEAIYQDLLANNKKQIEEEINQYQNNLAKITSVNNEITREINSWYLFANDPTNKTNTLFPLNYLTRKRKLQKNIKKASESISGLMINNRFIKEKLLNHELELKEQSFRKIEQCSSYKTYLLLNNSKKNIVKILKGLMPQVEGLCPVEVDISNLAPLLARLETALLDKPSIK